MKYLYPIAKALGIEIRRSSRSRESGYVMVSRSGLPIVFYTDLEDVAYELARMIAKRLDK